MNIPEKFLVASIVVKMAPCVHTHFLKLASHLFQTPNTNTTKREIHEQTTPITELTLREWIISALPLICHGMSAKIVI